MDPVSPVSLDEPEDSIKLKGEFKPDLDTSGELNDIAVEPTEILLIKLIEGEPAIFNPKHEDYRNISAKDVLWANISKRVGWAERHCKSKWKALRNQYCRELRRVRSNSKAVIKWRYFQHMDFLRPYALHRYYRPRMETRLHITKEHVNHDSNQKEINNKLVLALKADSLNSYSDSGQVSESTDVASQIIEQITQSESNGVIDEDPQDDDDDDPIHTFLRIESYFEKQLIIMVESEDVLYNHKNPLYRNPKHKMAVWDEIARKLKRTSTQCRLKWKGLRDQYIREYKRIMSTNSGNFMPRWKHYDSLRFLENFIRRKNCNDCSLEGNIIKPELDIPIEHLDQEQMTSLFSEAQYIIGDDDTTRSVELEEENTSYTLQNETDVDVSVEKPSAEQTPSQDDNDEVGSFFKAVAMKIRKANMSTMAFTELQIDILKVITNALRNP